MVRLEAILSGHEDRISSLRWRPGPPAARHQGWLLSASVDKTLQVRNFTIHIGPPPPRTLRSER
jgi:hypothetical protein